MLEKPKVEGNDDFKEISKYMQVHLFFYKIEKWISYLCIHDYCVVMRILTIEEQSNHKLLLRPDYSPHSSGQKTFLNAI
ncbi:hypothetical protein CUN85_04765 [Methanolobus halotolerans]|uniref:Uncharacterized protein n=1 Tax=Methanolobus halotolerans TaxID=2052935 RepID=A0A4E0PXU6_9EURY|nr:hypothetical protein CUN85_04765 [Methanolobus halotolerans]